VDAKTGGYTKKIKKKKDYYFKNTIPKPFKSPKKRR
jgi:hypothetical protein